MSWIPAHHGGATSDHHSQVGLKERADLQRWITQYPEIVGRDLLLVTTAFDQWEIRDQRVADPLDVLFLQSDGSLVVAELKRDHALDTTELQALKYAAYCSRLPATDIVDAYVRCIAVRQPARQWHRLVREGLPAAKHQRAIPGLDNTSHHGQWVPA